MTDEPEYKLKQVFSNIKNFFIFDVSAFVTSLNLNLNKQSSIYYINTEIEKHMLNALSLKRYNGIIYINKSLTEKLYQSINNKFKQQYKVDKIILIDDGQFPKHTDIMNIFDEVIFYNRFNKSKIIEPNEVPIISDKNNPNNNTQI